MREGLVRPLVEQERCQLRNTAKVRPISPQRAKNQPPADDQTARFDGRTSPTDDRNAPRDYQTASAREQTAPAEDWTAPGGE